MIVVDCTCSITLTSEGLGADLAGVLGLMPPASQAHDPDFASLLAPSDSVFLSFYSDNCRLILALQELSLAFNIIIASRSKISHSSPSKDYNYLQYSFLTTNHPVYDNLFLHVCTTPHRACIINSSSPFSPIYSIFKQQNVLQTTLTASTSPRTTQTTFITMSTQPSSPLTASINSNSLHILRTAATSPQSSRSHLFAPRRCCSPGI